MPRQDQVRPRLVDLATVDDDAQDALMQWPPAATVARKPPPQVGTRPAAPVAETSTEAGAPPPHEAGMRAKTVRFAGAAEHAPGAPPPPASHTPTDTADAAMPDEAPPHDAPFVPVLGAIRERSDAPDVSARPSRPRTAHLNPQQSTSRTRDALRDAHGKPLSAFRRSRLLQAPTRATAPEPPAFPDAPQPHAAPSPPPLRDPTRDPGGGAPPDHFASLLASVAAENADKVSQMSYATVEEELQDAASFFGADTLARLKARRACAPEASAPASAATPAAEMAAAPRETPSGPPAQGWPALERRLADVDLNARPAPPAPPPAPPAELEALRATYFPEEPETVNSALAWTVPQAPTSSLPPRVRFDFAGAVCWRPGETASDDRTYLAGLHHHGEHQQAPGYTLDELLHLVQSAVASQRTMALQVLGRVCARHPLRFANGLPYAGSCAGEGDADVAAALDADVGVPRAHILLSARWLLHDRHRSPRVAAVQCLAASLAAVCVVKAKGGEQASCAVSAPPHLDWLWLASLHPDAAWTPRASPAPFQAQDASYLELVRHDWAATLLQTDVLATLDALTAAHAALDAAARGGTPLPHEATETRHALLQIVAALVLHSTEAAQALPRHTHLVRLVAQLAGTACPWPLGPRAHWPLPLALRTVLHCVQSGRAPAEALMGQGVLGAVLRYLVLPPRTPDPDAEADAHAQTLVALAACVVATLARYALASTCVRELWPALQTLGPWAAASSAPSAAPVLAMLAAWTHVAHHAPRDGDLGANWPTVRTWAPWSVACALHSPNPEAQIAALDHLACWAHAASSLEPALTDELAERGALCEHIEAALAHAPETVRTHLAALDAACAARDVHETAASAAALVRVARHLGAATRLMHATPAWGWHTQGTCHALQRTLLGARLLDVLRMPVLGIDGTAAATQLVVLAACGVGLGEAPAAKTLAPSTAVPPLKHDLDCMLALAALPPQEGALAHRLLAALVQQWDTHLWTVLAPFLCDALTRAGTPPAPHFSLVQALQGATPPPPTWTLPSLVLGTPESDSVTGNALWQAPTAGLPLRRDWPLAPLDDLLHSGQARALNRADGLPPAWDFSEAEIVAATLQLAVHAMHATRDATYPTLPQAADVWLGLMKVFLLEQDAGEAERYSGAATGRDLYATEPIRGLLQTLMLLADCAALQDPSTSLESAADALRAGVSFYQTYTDLLGLYDAISLGDTVFARTLLPPLAMAYAPDYRRLLWSDYAACLRSITTPLHDVPVPLGGPLPPNGGQTNETGNDARPIAHMHRLSGYLYPLETDRVVLGCYAQALVARQVTEHQPFLHHIAVHHLAAALWACDEHWPTAQRVDDREALAMRVFAATTPAEVQATLLHYEPAGVAVDAAGRAALRARWVST